MGCVESGLSRRHHSHQDLSLRRLDTAVVSNDDSRSILRDDVSNPVEAKVVLLGDSGVGKSSIVMRFCQGRFLPFHEVTIGAAFLQQSIEVQNGHSLKLHIWDTGGQERFRAMAPLYYREASGAVVVWDCTQIESLASVKYWCEELRAKASSRCCIAVVANKADAVQAEKNQYLAMMTAEAARKREESAGDGGASGGVGGGSGLSSKETTATEGEEADIMATAAEDEGGDASQTVGSSDASAPPMLSDPQTIARRYQAMQESRAFCDAENFLCVECSAKTGQNVNLLFEELASRISQQRTLPS